MQRYSYKLSGNAEHDQTRMQIDRMVMRLLLEREVWGLNPGQVEFGAQCCQQLAIVNCVAESKNVEMGQINSSHASAGFSESSKELAFDLHEDFFKSTVCFIFSNFFIVLC